MLKPNEVTVTPELIASRRKWLEEAREEGARSGLHGLATQFLNALSADVYSTAQEHFGVPPTSPEKLAERALETRQRGDEAARRVDAFFAGVREKALSANPFRPLFAWRGCLIVLFAAALVGLLRSETSVRGIAVLVLSSALAVLVLPLVPFAAQFGLRACRAVAGCARDMAVAGLSRREWRRLERSAQVAEDHVARTNLWAAAQMGHLTAAFEYEKSVGAAARAAL
jgi:hypothetical protein